MLDDRTVYPDAADDGAALHDLGARSENPAADEPAVDAHQDGQVDVHYRQRRCSHSHCSGCSRTQPSTTLVIACMVPWTSILPSASRTGSTGSVRSAMEAAVRQPDDAGAVNGAFRLARQHGDQRIGHAAAAEERHLDAAHVVLIDQDRDMAIGCQSARQPHRRQHGGRHQSRPCDPRECRRSHRRPPSDWGGGTARAYRARRRRRAMAGSSQLARCAAKISAGLPSSRSRLKRSAVPGV